MGEKKACAAACQLVSLFRAAPPGFTAQQAAAERLLEAKHTLNKHTDCVQRYECSQKGSKKIHTSKHAEYIHKADMEKKPSHSDATCQCLLTNKCT